MADCFKADEMDITILNYQTEIMKLAEKYCRLTDTNLGALGKKVLNDFTFFTRVSEGANCNVKTLRRVVRWFAENMPEEGISGVPARGAAVEAEKVMRRSP
jgi:hypothetical protein